jgi:hypothetical protein
MPWSIQERDGKFCVVVKSGPKKGKTTACHDSREKAQRQLRALYANTSEAEYSQMGAIDRLQVRLARR